MNVFEQMKERYESGSVPWDSDSPPPEVTALVGLLTPGKALDLGCGYGRASIFLAENGWQIDAIDYVPEAIKEAKERAKKAEQAQAIRFHVASVSKLDFLKEGYQFALDVGCMHVLGDLELQDYRDGLIRLLEPGATYLLFARLRQDGTGAGEEDHGVQDRMIRSLFSDGFQLYRVQYGETHVMDSNPWKSAWYWFRRVKGTA